MLYVRPHLRTVTVTSVVNAKGRRMGTYISQMRRESAQERRWLRSWFTESQARSEVFEIECRYMLPQLGAYMKPAQRAVQFKRTCSVRNIYQILCKHLGWSHTTLQVESHGPLSFFRGWSSCRGGCE